MVAMGSRDIHDLHPFMREKARVFLIKAAEASIALLVTRTYCSVEEQDELYAQGRTKPGKVVTNAKGGESAHNFRLAFDCVPIDDKKQPIWNAPDSVWQVLYAIADKVGLDAMGAKGGEYLSWDKGHFSEGGWRYIKDVG